MHGHLNRGDGKAILSIGEDPSLLHTRQLVLEQAGYAVYSVSGMELPLDRQMQDFDAAILCHTLPDELSKSVATILREAYPALPTLQLCSREGNPQRSFDGLVPGYLSPDGLLERVHAMVTLKAMAKPPRAAKVVHLPRRSRA